MYEYVETVDSLEEYHTWMISEMQKSEPDLATVNRYMALTFASRRREVIQGALTCTVMERWPVLFTSAQVAKFYMVLFQYIACTLCFKKVTLLLLPCNVVMTIVRKQLMQCILSHITKCYINVSYCCFCCCYYYYYYYY